MSFCMQIFFQCGNTFECVFCFRDIDGEWNTIRDTGIDRDREMDRDRETD
jgi:hypothetical protein